MEHKPLYLAFVWNQHQPYYKDTSQKKYIMPWVRLHAAKNYYQMAAILENYPQIRQTFNLTPSLLEQLEDYATGNYVDHYQQVMKPTADLTEADRRFLLQHYFDLPWERIIDSVPRYRELLDMQGRQREPHLDPEVLERFSEEDFRDLQVWFNLAWVDPEIRAGDPFLSHLENKHRLFSEGEREKLMEKQMELLKEVIPVHRRLYQLGRIELITTPFYHPIAPLLLDNYSALRANPHLPMPERYAYREDLYAHLNASLEQFNRHFSGQPEGVWPSEQAVSPEIIPVFSDLGFSWTISDEQILERSLDTEIYRDSYGHVLNPEVLYQPYQVNVGGREMVMVFRDRVLSDRIGFEYQHFHGDHAAEDLVHRLHQIRRRLKHAEGRYLVTISLDGENAWEWYPDDKRTFLHGLYRRLSHDPLLQCVTVSDYLKQFPPRRMIKHLYTGSWVDHSLTRWIGSENKNAMWDYLARARRAVEDYQEKSKPHPGKLKSALHNVYIAEGSDYQWWVDSMPYYLAAPFENLFRKHVANIYRSLDLVPPQELFAPLLQPEPGEAVWEEDPLAGPVTMAHGRSNGPSPLNPPSPSGREPEY